LIHLFLPHFLHPDRSHLVSFADRRPAMPEPFCPEAVPHY
jgi:hypothetical protein